MPWETDVQGMGSFGFSKHTSVPLFYQSPDEMSNRFKVSHATSYCVFVYAWVFLFLCTLVLIRRLCVSVESVKGCVTSPGIVLGTREELACRTRVELLKVKHDWAYVWIPRMLWESSPTLSASFGMAACLVVQLSPSPCNEKSVLH